MPGNKFNLKKNGIAQTYRRRTLPRPSGEAPSGLPPMPSTRSPRVRSEDWPSHWTADKVREVEDELAAQAVPDEDNSEQTMRRIQRRMNAILTGRGRKSRRRNQKQRKTRRAHVKL